MLIAADGAGWRNEHLDILTHYHADGATRLYELANYFFTKGHLIPDEHAAWLFSGRLIALAKPGDDPEAPPHQRKIRPVAIGSVFRRLTSKTACKTFRESFNNYFNRKVPRIDKKMSQHNSLWPSPEGLRFCLTQSGKCCQLIPIGLT